MEENTATPGENGDKPRAGLLLEQWLQKSGKTRGDLAREMGIGVSHLGQIINGKRNPWKPTRVLIEVLTNNAVPRDAWETTR